MENNHIIKLMNPKVVTLEIKLVTTRKTIKGTIKKLREPRLWLNAAIEVTEPLSPCCMYQDEHQQAWYAMPNPTDVVVIRNPITDVKSFKMPTELQYTFSPAPANSSAQPQGELVYVNKGNKTKFTVELYNKLIAKGVQFTVATERGDKVDVKVFESKNFVQGFISRILYRWDVNGKSNGYSENGLDLYIIER